MAVLLPGLTEKAALRELPQNEQRLDLSHIRRSEMLQELLEADKAERRKAREEKAAEKARKEAVKAAEGGSAGIKPEEDPSATVRAADAAEGGNDSPPARAEPTTFVQERASE